MKSPINEFRKECREFASKWIKVHKEQFKRLGVIGDWENYYSTMTLRLKRKLLESLENF